MDGMGKTVPILAICGRKNAGKTTIIERLLPLLSAVGLQVAVVKHDGHHFTPDTPGTDSFRFFAAGACGAAVFDGEKFSLVRRCRVDGAFLAGQFPEADLILLEGFKDSAYPKLEILRGGASAELCGRPGTHLAIVSDIALKADVPVVHPDDAAGIVKIVLRFCQENQEVIP